MANQHLGPRNQPRLACSAKLNPNDGPRIVTHWNCTIEVLSLVEIHVHPLDELFVDSVYAAIATVNGSTGASARSVETVGTGEFVGNRETVDYFIIIPVIGPVSDTTEGWHFVCFETPPDQVSTTPI